MMRISKFLPDDIVEQFRPAELKIKDGMHGGKTYALMIRAVGTAMLQPHKPYLLKLEGCSSLELNQKLHTCRRFISKAQLKFIELTKTNEGIEILYLPWRDEYLKAKDIK